MLLCCPLQRHDAQCAWSATVVAEWRAALERDGYLLLDGLVPRATVLDARRTVLHSLRERGLILPPADADNTEDDDDAALAAVAVDPLAPTNLLSESVTNTISRHARPVSSMLAASLICNL